MAGFFAPLFLYAAGGGAAGPAVSPVSSVSGAASEPVPGHAAAFHRGDGGLFGIPGGGGHGKMGDLRAFRANISDHPEIAAAALIRILKDMEPPAAERFVERQSFQIAEMLSGLAQLSGSGRIPKQDYLAIRSALAPFDILPPDTVDQQLPVHRGPLHGKRNPIPELVDTRATMNSGDKKAAVARVQALTRNYPDNPSVQAAAASYYVEMRDYTMAEKTATEAIKLDEENPDAYKTRALARASLEDRKGALEDIKKAMSIDPQDESAKILSILLESRKSVTTLKSLSSAEDVKKALGSSGGAEAAVAAGEPADGGAAYGAPEPSFPAAAAGAGAAAEAPPEGRGQSPDPDRSKAYLQTAFSKTRLGDYGNAVKYAGIAIEKDPDNLDAYLERANASNFLGRYDDAVRDTTVVLQKEPENLQALNMRAWALNKKGLSGEAETDSSRAINLNPDFADAWFNRALAYEKQGDYKKTLENFKQAAALNRAYQGRYQDAVAQYGALVPGFSAGLGAAAAGVRGAYEGVSRQKRSPLRRFLILLFFTLTGGALVALGLVHIMTAKTAAASARSTHPDVLSPSVFYEGVATGKYRIERKIGEGGMGVVYEAVDQSLGRKVAIKKMNEEIKVNEREKQRFLEEARTVALLHHPNIVEIYTIFEEEENIYLVFEYVSGQTLDRLLDKEARLSLARAVKIFDEVSKALVYAHSKNIIHRDLKLSNIMLSEENEVKVMDFGLASRAKESLARFSNKEVVGSPAYMAPEQDLGVSSREADIYSLGVCLYEALTGVLPFAGPNFHEQKARGRFQPASAAVPGSPKALDRLLEKALSPEPENRFHSAEEFNGALLDLAQAAGISPETEDRGRAAGQGPQYKTFPV